MTEQAKVPEIRFAGFTDPWEQRKLGELITELSSGKSVNSEKGAVGPSDIGILKTSCVSYDMFDPTECKRVVDAETRMVSCPVEAGTLIVSRMNTPDRVGACGFVPGDRTNLFLPDRLWKVKLTPEVDPYLIFVLLVSASYKARLKGMASGTSGSMHNIPKDSFGNLDVTLPRESKEQRTIGSMFEQLDNLITLHQRKYDKLVVFKKSMLEKMFPKDGESVPEIRFAGFTDPWEQRKLGEFSKKNTIKNANGALSETFTNSAEQGVISQLDYFDHDITNDANISGYYVVQPDDFVYNPRISATAPCGPINRNRLNRAGVMSPLYTVFSVDASMDKTYLEHYFKTSRWHDFMFLEGNTGARSDRFSISDATFFEMPIWCPEISEQMAIAKQLETTDTLITLHQRKLELLRNIKKSLLDKMFV